VWGINGTLCRTPPNAEDFEQGAHIRALLLQAIAQTALTLTALKSEDLEGTAKMKVAAQIRGFGRQDQALEQLVVRLSLEGGVSSISWSVTAQILEESSYSNQDFAVDLALAVIPAVSCRACSRGRFFGRFASFLLFQLRWKRVEAKGEFASRILVSLPIAFHGFGHIPGGRAQPIRFSASQVLQNAGDLAFASQVNIRCFRAHCIEKRFLVALFRQVGNFNGI